MHSYLAHLWLALRGTPGFVVVKRDDYRRLLDRVISYERRAQAQKAAREAKATPLGRPPQPGPIEGF